MSSPRPYIPNRKGFSLSQDRVRGPWKDELRIWWREIDKVVLLLIGILMAIGTAAVAAASPASAERLSTSAVRLDEFMFLKQHLVWQTLGIGTMLAASMLSRENARRLGILLAAAMLGALFLVPVIGTEVNGSKRWINLGMRFQPSEFLKPGFAILLSWILAWRLRDQNLPVLGAASGVMALVAALLMIQPNLGDTLLFGGVWFVLILLSGVSVQRISALVGVGVVGLTAAYFLYDNARHRIDSFLGGGTAFDQVDLAERTLLAGGWTGTGLWLGIRKMNLPEAHTDYIFSVIGEEFGLLICALVVLLYLAILLRVLVRLADEDNLFVLLAGAGLITQIGGQAFINILVNLQLFPSKGMTLPLVSYGGSSTIAVALTVGLLLAITRRNPYLQRETPGLFEMLGQKEEAA
ncbi:Cell division protein FtsW [Altererythrobacter epoxidivorans]|uniref:Probable peptidoglycan glycosyltransferase FtsW n=1 Tax=Altererythrobacter epoxidivorans TaxID=361183 RepID=A0A0M4LVH7_9SPHN|nr:putative peptidoglycan glycosyltransferase FtsW [Altererythrobacter epoxidivorans]ALE17154.1 Cell division protein FtsW [Altererythrobacter epoxidivorans]